MSTLLTTSAAVFFGAGFVLLLFLLVGVFEHGASDCSADTTNDAVVHLMAAICTCDAACESAHQLAYRQHTFDLGSDGEPVIHHDLLQRQERHIDQDPVDIPVLRTLAVERIHSPFQVCTAAGHTTEVLALVEGTAIHTAADALRTMEVAGLARSPDHNLADCHHIAGMAGRWIHSRIAPCLQQVHHNVVVGSLDCSSGPDFDCVVGSLGYSLDRSLDFGHNYRIGLHRLHTEVVDSCRNRLAAGRVVVLESCCDSALFSSLKVIFVLSHRDLKGLSNSSQGGNLCSCRKKVYVPDIRQAPPAERS